VSAASNWKVAAREKANVEPKSGLQNAKRSPGCSYAKPNFTRCTGSLQDFCGSPLSAQCRGMLPVACDDAGSRVDHQRLTAPGPPVLPARAAPPVAHAPSTRHSGSRTQDSESAGRPGLRVGCSLAPGGPGFGSRLTWPRAGRGRRPADSAPQTPPRGACDFGGDCEVMSESAPVRGSSAQGTEPPIPIPAAIPDLPGIEDGTHGDAPPARLRRFFMSVFLFLFSFILLVDSASRVLAFHKDARERGAHDDCQSPLPLRSSRARSESHGRDR
jgi:hypothetical protein